jgi:hypothetical protein
LKAASARQRPSPNSSSRFHRDTRKLTLFLAGLLVSAGALILLQDPATTPKSRSGGGRAVPGASFGSPSRSPRSEVPAPRAREVATAWVEAYGTSHFRDSRREALRELRPYSSPRLLAEMAADSGAPALVRARRQLKQRTRAVVEAAHVQDGSRVNSALVVVYDYTTITTGGRTSDLRTITLELDRTRDGWKVGEVLVP